tara:strand:- start:190 stop:669 length:480 start_codon:yes stop_codon:yes gene_type:complete
MKRLVILLFSVAVVAEENPYSSISKRNAFKLTEGLPPASTILDMIETPRVQLFLTGVTRLRGETKAHMYSKDLPHKYLSLKVGEQSGPVRVLSISKDVVKVVNDGNEETLSFAFNSLKTTVVSTKGKPTAVKKDDSKEDDRDKRRRQYDEWRKKNESPK